MSLARVDRVASAAARLPGYLRKTRWLELLGAIAAEVQEVEDMWLAMLASNAIDDATGAQLDQIGGLVAQPRGGASDVDYRRRIRAKVATNRSMGLVGDILRLARLVVNDSAASISLENEGIASYVLRLHAAAVPDATATDLAAFVRKATSAGVRGVTEYATVADDDAFTFDGPAGLGFPATITLDLATVLTGGAGYDTVIGIRPEVSEVDAAALTLQFVDDGGGTGTFDDGPVSIVYHFEPGVTSMTDLEGKIGNSAWLYVAAASTIPISLLGDVAADNFGPVNISTVGTPAVTGGAFATALE